MKRSWHRAALAVGGLTMALAVPQFTHAQHAEARTCVGGFVWLLNSPHPVGDTTCGPTESGAVCVPVNSVTAGTGFQGAVCLNKPFTS